MLENRLRERKYWLWASDARGVDGWCRAGPARALDECLRDIRDVREARRRNPKWLVKLFYITRAGERPCPR